MSAAAFGQRLRSSGAWAAGGRISSGLLLLALHGVLARSISKADYGHYVLVESAALVISLICMAGIPTVTLRLLRTSLSTNDHQQSSQIVSSSFWLFAGTSALTVVLTMIVSEVWSSSLPDGLNVTWLPWFLSWGIMAAGLRILSEIYRAYDHYSMSYGIGGQSGGLILNGSLVVFSVVAAATGRMSLPLVLTLQVVVQFGLMFVSAMSLRSHLTSFRGPRNSGMMGLIAVSAWPLLAQQLVSIGLPEAGKIMLGVYATADDVALYNAAVRLVILAHVPLMVVNNAIQPFITELYFNRETQQLNALVRGSATLAALPCLGVFALFLILPEFVLRVSFGPGFEEAATALRILTIGSLAWVLSGSCGLVLMMTGFERSCMLATLLPGLVFLAICPWLIQEFGVAGAAAGSTFLQLFSNGISLLLVYWHHRIWTTVTLSRRLITDCLTMVSSGRRNQL